MYTYVYKICTGSRFGTDLYTKEKLTDDEFKNIVIDAYRNTQTLDDMELGRYILSNDQRFFKPENIDYPENLRSRKATSMVMIIDDNDIFSFIITHEENIETYVRGFC